NYRSENSEYDVARAKALLDMYGYVDRNDDGWRELPDGKPLVIEYATEPDAADRQFDELWQKNMTAIGIRLRFKSAQWPEQLKAAQAGSLMVWQLGGTNASSDFQDSLQNLYGPAAGGQNLSRFKDPQFDSLYRPLQSLPDGPERLALMRDALKIITAYMPQKYNVHRIVTWLMQPWLLGLRAPLYGNLFWQYVDIDDSKRQAKKESAPADCRHAIARTADPALHAMASRVARPRLRRDDAHRLRPALALVVRRAARLLAIDLGLVRDRIADAARRGARRRDDAGRAVVPRRGGQLRAASPAPRRAGACRRSPGDRFSQRDDAAPRRDPRDRLARIAPAGRGAGRRVLEAGRRPWRPRRRVHARRAADGGRVSRLRQPRRGVVGVLGGHGPARRARPLSPDRARPAHRLRRLHLWRHRARPDAGARRATREASDRARCRSLGPSRRRRRPRAPRAPIAPGARFRRPRRIRSRLRAALARLRPSALDRLLERPDRPAESDRARTWRRHARIAQGGGAAQQRRRQRRRRRP